MNRTALSASSDVWSNRAGLFVVSWLILFLELACIRWFPAHVLFLTFFTNIVLLACFLGMSLGCLTAKSRRHWLSWTPVILLVALLAAQGIEHLWRHGLENKDHAVWLDVGQKDPQMVYFGAEKTEADVAKFFIPLEVVGGFFFVLLALAFVGPGQELGRALDRIPDRVQAYTVNILGSVVGILSFVLCSFLGLPPVWWFGLAGLAGVYLLSRLEGAHRLVPSLGGAGLAAVAVVSSWNAGTADEQYWSPYYRVDYYRDGTQGATRPPSFIDANLIGHQSMIPRHKTTRGEYALPYLLGRDTRDRGDRPPFEDVLIIGAGSGNDVSRSLQFGAAHVDAVEIDPVIQRLGHRDHPDRPYDDARVRVHLDDGRNFLRSTDRQYDLIVYALVDSLVLHSSYSNIRLESYLFTEEAFRDVKARLKPDGVFVMYNFFRHGWIVARIEKALKEAFAEPPLVLGLPPEPVIHPDSELAFTLFLAGHTKPLREAFARHDHYWLNHSGSPGPSLTQTPNGFTRTDHPSLPRGARLEGSETVQWSAFEPAVVTQPEPPLAAATDDWPFLYLRQPALPGLSVRGLLMMAGLAALLLFCFFPRHQVREAGWLGADLRMFFLGAGFMLIETKAVVHLALLFGSTWAVNSVVFLAVLVMILLANLYVLWARPRSLTPFAVGLVAALLLNVAIGLDFFLGMDRPVQLIGSCLLVFAPILFAAVIFALSFSRTAAADRAFGANIAGAMMGGLAENASMLIGFQSLLWVALALYLLALLARMPAQPAAPAPLDA